MSTIPPTSAINQDFVMLIDPTNFGGKLRVPISKTFETKGRNDWLRGTLKKDLSLCCLFQKSKCHAGAKCHQVHADRNFIAELRSQCSQITSCCARCGDTATTFPAGVSLFNKLRAAGVTGLLVGDCHLPLDQAAFTIGFGAHITAIGNLKSQIRNDELMVNPSRVCRLHLRGGCKYGKDCKNIHLCSKLGENFVLRPAAGSERQSISSTSSRRSSIGNTPKDLTPQEAAALVIHNSFSQVTVSPEVKKEAAAVPRSAADSLEHSLGDTKLPMDALQQRRERHCFGDDLDEAMPPPSSAFDFCFDISSLSPKQELPTFDQQWGGSPVPCIASSSLRQMVAC
jgi:hypothetical protein